MTLIDDIHIIEELSELSVEDFALEYLRSCLVSFKKSTNSEQLKYINCKIPDTLVFNHISSVLISLLFLSFEIRGIPKKLYEHIDPKYMVYNISNHTIKYRLLNQHKMDSFLGLQK